MLSALDPALFLGTCLVEVGGDNLTAKTGEQSRQRFAANAEPKPAPARPQHVTLTQSLGDVAPFPELPMTVSFDKAAIPCREEFQRPRQEGFGLKLRLGTET